ncbi:MAG: hypothetical protein Q7J59_02355, partial [Elusimicrobiota bacterium]|nr:hypothetical protein [Elusimicrobiota bacterium]
MREISLLIFKNIFITFKKNIIATILNYPIPCTVNYVTMAKLHDNAGKPFRTTLLKYFAAISLLILIIAPVKIFAITPQITVYSTNLVDEDTLQIEQGTSKLGMLRLDMVTSSSTVPWTRITLALTGSADGGVYDSQNDEYIPSTDIESVRIYKDAQSSGQEGWKVFLSSTDTLISSGNETFGQLQPGICVINLKNPSDLSSDMAQDISESTATYFVAFSFANSAAPGTTVGVKLTNSSAVQAWVDGINRVYDYYDYNGNGIRDDDEPDIFPLSSESPPII